MLRHSIYNSNQCNSFVLLGGPNHHFKRTKVNKNLTLHAPALLLKTLVDPIGTSKVAGRWPKDITDGSNARLGPPPIKAGANAAVPVRVMSPSELKTHRIRLIYEYF